LPLEFSVNVEDVAESLPPPVWNDSVLIVAENSTAWTTTLSSPGNQIRLTNLLSNAYFQIAADGSIGLKAGSTMRHFGRLACKAPTRTKTAPRRYC
jgi:hypothetical protein